MSVQRVYIAPNCNLRVEGLGGDGGTLNLITYFECQFYHNQAKITGGRDLLIHLIQAVGAYAQGVQLGQPVIVHVGAVTLKPEATCHTLHVTLDDALGGTAAASPEALETHLSLVQLFDLVESLDQLCGDRHSIAELKPFLDVEPFIPRPSIAHRALPAIIGISSFVVLAGIIFLVPPPEPKPAEPIAPKIETPK
ncbi:MAG: DUF4335 domain-containing protein [Oscillatoriales cyanobacterium SM2_2_1]|nr:DUF4335 domain-containing protein [Oscillatoriales cyanobacterium SM2_2_1]